MPLTQSEYLSLSRTALELRKDIIDVTLWANGSHIGGALSIVEILTLLYFKVLRINPANPKWMERDRFILSKGHAGVAHVCALSRRGYFDRDLLKSFNHYLSPFGMHLDVLKVRGLDVSTGSLGHGLSIAAGLALGARHQNLTWRTYCIVGDGECAEGSIWEAANAAGHYKLDNLMVFVDRNNLSLDGRTEDIMQLEPLAERWRSFGWQVEEVDGHDLNRLMGAIENLQAQSGKPSVIIAHTVKGKGVPLMENDFNWHYGKITPEQALQFKAEIDDGIISEE